MTVGTVVDPHIARCRFLNDVRTAQCAIRIERVDDMPRCRVDAND